MAFLRAGTHAAASLPLAPWPDHTSSPARPRTPVGSPFPPVPRNLATSSSFAWVISHGGVCRRAVALPPLVDASRCTITVQPVLELRITEHRSAALAAFD